MKAFVKFELTEMGRKADILAGGTGQQIQEHAIERDHEEFARAVRLGAIETEGVVVSLGYSPYRVTPWDVVPTVTQVLDRKEDTKRRYDEEQAASKAKAREETLAVLRDRVVNEEMIKFGLTSTPFIKRSPAWPYPCDPTVKESDEAVAWIAELNAANAIEQDKAEAAEAEYREAKRIKDEAERTAATAKEAARRAELGLQDGDDDYTIEAGALSQVPIWESHRRGKNWMAVVLKIDPKSPGGIARAFADKAKGDCYYILPALDPGDAIEFGADYYSGGGSPTRNRWYGYVVRIDAERLVLRKCSTAKAALTAGAKHCESLATA